MGLVEGVGDLVFSLLSADEDEEFFLMMELEGVCPLFSFPLNDVAMSTTISFEPLFSLDRKLNLQPSFLLVIDVKEPS